MTQKTTSQVTEHIESLRKDLSTRLDALDKDIWIARERGLTTRVSELETRRDQINKAYELGFDRARKELDQAAKIEEDQAAQTEARRASVEAEEKDKAFRAWVRNGGNQQDFEEVWPKLRETQIIRATLNQIELSNESGPASKIKL